MGCSRGFLNWNRIEIKDPKFNCIRCAATRHDSIWCWTMFKKGVLPLQLPTMIIVIVCIDSLSYFRIHYHFKNRPFDFNLNDSYERLSQASGILSFSTDNLLTIMLLPTFRLLVLVTLKRSPLIENWCCRFRYIHSFSTVFWLYDLCSSKETLYSVNKVLKLLN